MIAATQKLSNITCTVHWTVIFLILWKSALEDSFSVKCYWQKNSVDYFQKKTKDNNH